ncbi:tyrosine-type recombinase/integrase [Sagittula stellata]|uniref:Putative integrase/resolvase recombinase protein n=1 Tax=Sagittula stellata (strain ATCC 700073 / DSM 11524 / E-37) TaxID=388399 RepID=A3K9P0_SAGS3|nr:tyrosine-type recombinase/integrase [Sagittula stellata]EBA06184.1 putative integrase/resolvase recombinase protein [Sagittula stellata E-37]
MRDNLATRIDTEMPQETTTWQTPRSLLEAANITEQSRAVLDGEMQICLETAFELFINARSLGYRPGALRLDAARGEHWHRISGANTQSAKRVWTRALGNPFFSDIEREDIVVALEKIRNLPKCHGKRSSSGTDHESGLGKETSARDRIGISTFLKFGRTARQVGDLLVELNLEDANPFDICSWSTAEEACLRQQERPSETREWSEAVESYLSSPIFKGDMRDAGDPLFWIPLLMCLGGLRLDEAVHLTTEDLQFRHGMPVICIDRDGKTPAACREIPVTRRLQDLGLVELFELRRDQNEALLFPQLAADRPGTATARFRKDFIRYCETHGIDASTLHAQDFRRALHHALLDQECPDHVVRNAMGQMSRDTWGRFLDDSLLQTVQQALTEAGAGLTDIVGPNR